MSSVEKMSNAELLEEYDVLCSEISTMSKEIGDLLTKFAELKERFAARDDELKRRNLIAGDDNDSEE